MLSTPVLARELPFVSAGETLFMAKTRMIMMAIAIAMAGAIGITSSALATPAPVVQLGIVNVGGTLTSGGSANYSFYFSTTATGLLAVKGSITSTGYLTGTKKKWTATLPNFSTTLSAGTTKVTGTSVVIPTNFTGVANLTVTVTFAGKGVATKTVAFTVAAPVVAGSVSTNLYGVGFENAVTMNAGIVSTYAMSSPTYTWIQTGGKTVTLSSTGSITPNFTTDALTNFVAFAMTNVVMYSDSQTLRTNDGVQVVSMDDEQSTAAVYSFKVLVSGSSITRTGLFTVTCASSTPGHPNVPVGALMSFKSSTNSTSWTLVKRPSNSTATLTHTNSLLPQFRADVEGVYAVRDNVTGAIETNTAASWTGYQFCSICHGPDNNFNNEDIVTEWQQTKHASFLQKAIDGQESAYYNSSCIRCHTVGYNPDPKANNGGFDDVAKTLGWTFPTVLTNGNYAAMPDALKNLSNIQCESCHGPGSRHPGSPSISLDVKVCATCHQDGSHHVRPQQWESSSHAGSSNDDQSKGGYSKVSLNQGMNSQCSRCHSPVGYLAVAKGTPNVLATTNSVPIGSGPLACQICHDPHDTFGNADRHQLRVYDSFQMGNPYYRTNTIYVALGDSLTTADLRLTNSNVVVTNAGASAACMICHNGRDLPTQTKVYGTNTVLSAKTLRPTTIGVTKFYQVGNAHDSTAANAFTGIGAYDYGQVMGNSFHTYLADCQACHMYQLKAGDTILTNGIPVVLTAGNLANYVNVVGDHTFKMSYTAINGTDTNLIENIAACNQCHTEPVTTFDFKAVNAEDYDGNGVKDGIQTEMQGLLDILGKLIKATGVTITTNATTGHVTAISSSTGYSTNNAALVDAQSKAAWNWLTAYNEGSFGVHNTRFSVNLIQTTYTDLSTNYYGNSVTNTFHYKFPSSNSTR